MKFLRTYEDSLFNMRFNLDDYVKIRKKFFDIEDQFIANFIYQVKKIDVNDKTYFIKGVDVPKRNDDKYDYDQMWVEDKDLIRAKDHEVQAAKYNL